MSANAFLRLSERGQNTWWRYALASAAIIFFWFVVGSLLIVALAVYVEQDRSPGTYFDPLSTRFVGIDPLWGYLALNFSFIALLFGLFLAVRVIHQRSMRTLVTPRERVNWRRVAQGFGVWGALVLFFSLVEFALRPAAFQFTLDVARFVPFALLILVVTPLQTSAEELLFRGYLMQSLARRVRWRAVVVGVSSLLFMLGHLGNPEVAADFWLLALYYLSFGVWAALITLKDESLELALGVHAANNLFAALFFNYVNSVLDTPSVFMVTSIDARFNLVSFLIAAALFYMWFFARKSHASNITAHSGL